MNNRTTFKVSFFLKRTAIKKSGKMPIIARISIDNKLVHFTTKKEILDEMWSVSRGCAIGISKESKGINEVLDAIKSTLISIYHEKRQLGINVTAEKLRNLFFGHDDSQETLLVAFARMNSRMKKLVNVEITASTYRTYELAKRRATEYLKTNYNLSDIAMRDLTLDFLKEYEAFLKVNCKLSHNVAGKMIQFLTRVVADAFNNGSIPSNPFASFHFKRNKVDRGFLTKEELNKIMSKEIGIKRLEQMRDIFIFCTFTGLSYIDVKQLTHSCIRETEDGDLWIMTKRQKTNTNVDVLLLDIPKQIILKYKDKSASKYVLPVLSNQKCNSYLKELADICLIDRNLTFHMSRHTFATTVTLSNGVPIETVSRVLGHSNLKTTQIYAKITRDKINDDMQALSGKLKGFNKTYIG